MRLNTVSAPPTLSHISRVVVSARCRVRSSMASNTVCSGPPTIGMADRPALITTAKTGLGSVIARTVEAVAARTADGVFSALRGGRRTRGGRPRLDGLDAARRLRDFPALVGKPRAWGPQESGWRAWFGGKIVDGLCEVLDEHLAVRRRGVPAAIGCVPWLSSEAVAETLLALSVFAW